MKVSVCIPTYNQSLYLEKAIRSANRQTLAPYEIIVSDDASTDETPEVLNRLSAEIPHLKIIRQPANLGTSLNVDACLRAATGEFVVRLDSDDLLLPGYVEKLVGLLQAFPHAGYAHAAVMEVDQHDRAVKVRRLIRKSGYQKGGDALKAAISGYRVSANIILFRKEALQKAGYIKNIADFAEDYYLCASIAAQGYGNCYMDEVLSNYRVWMDAGKVRQKRKLAEINGLRRVFTEVLEPAYRQNYSILNLIKNKRSAFACQHADCLGWDEYSPAEKKELGHAIDRLSGSKRVKVVKWIYSNGYGESLKKAFWIMGLPKQLLKAIILRFRGSNQALVSVSESFNSH
ncbi:MAG TPA: glycosyltransferase family 2 protein [Cyclobacteriaceae bacterium]|nr:glycosyltransferase family 2 protein [Cyclobacteriaceae bacterium]